MSFRAQPVTTATAAHVGRRTRVVLLSLASVLTTVAISGSRPAAQKSTVPAPVRTLASGGQTASTPGVKGATYYSLEARTVRYTTRFADGTKAVAERGIDGDVLTTLEDAQGNELGRFRADRNDGVHDVFQYEPAGRTPVLAQADPAVRVTLDWANNQSHKLYEDRVVSGTRLEWQGNVMRRAGATGGSADPDTDVREVETQWPDGLSAKTARVHSKSGDTFDGRAVQGDILVTSLMRHGVEIGVANYLTRERVYAWKIAGLTEGEIANEHLKARHGGWPFTPDMVWMNLQTLAFHHWKTAIAQKGFVARGGSCQPAPAVTERLLQFLAPVVHADEAGCDGLHWLDGTTLRYCCDLHDRCYSKYGCSSNSWWQFWSSWTCDMCNMEVAWCFAGGGVKGPFYPFP